MFNKWKEKPEVPGDRGRRPVMNTNEARDAVKESFKEKSHNSNTFQLQDMKKSMEAKRKEKTEKDGLETETVDVHVSN